MSPCPPVDSLRGLADDPDGQLAAHVDTCLACQNTLRELTAAGFPVPRPQVVSEEDRQLRERLKRLAEEVLGSIPEQPRPRPTVPGYEMLEELGQGGMGVVWKARQLSLDRIVALKVLTAGGLASSEALRRFQQEASALARLSHPGIVQVFDYGTHAGQPFLALEFCPGGSLAERLGGNPAAPAVAARAAEQLADAVEAAHKQGFIHRDLKPANVLLRDPGQGLSFQDFQGPQAPLLITDFGLAKQVNADAGLTQSGRLLGTPSYMAPEQIAESKDGVGPWTDVYALGAILYELLTGRPPFRAAAPTQTLLQVKSDDPVPPRRLQPGVPVDLETICLKCLRKEPAQRYARASELAADLRRFLRGEPIVARPPSTVLRVVRWCRRKPLLAFLVSVSAFLALLLVGTSLLALWKDREAERARNAESLAHRQREADYQHLMRIHADLIQEIDKQKEDSPESLRLKRRLLENHATHLESLTQGRANEPTALRSLAGVFRTALLMDLTSAKQPFAESEPGFERAIVALRKLRRLFPQEASIREQLGHFLVMRATILWTLGRMNEADQDAREVLAVGLQPVPPSATPEPWKHWLPQALLVIGDGHRHREELPEAVRAIKQALAYWEFVEHPREAEHLLNLFCRSLSGLSQLENPTAHTVSRELWQRLGQELERKQGTAATLDRGLAHFRFATWRQLGETLCKKGNSTDGLCLLFQAACLARELDLPGVTHPSRASLDYEQYQLLLDIASVCCRASKTWHDVGRHEEAQRGFQFAAELAGRARELVPHRAEGHIVFAVALHKVANVLADTKRFEESLSVYLQAVTVRERLCADYADNAVHHSDVSGTWNNLGAVLEQLGRDEEAKMAFEMAVSRLRSALARDPTRDAWQRTLSARLQSLSRLRQRLGHLPVSTNEEEVRAGSGHEVGDFRSGLDWRRPP